MTTGAGDATAIEVGAATVAAIMVGEVGIGNLFCHKFDKTALFAPFFLPG